MSLFEPVHENEKDRLGAVQSFRSLVLQQDWLRTRTGKTMPSLFETVHENEKDRLGTVQSFRSLVLFDLI